MCYTVVVIKIDTKIQFKCNTKREGLAMTRREKEVFDNYQNDLIFKFMQFKPTDVDSFEYNLAYAQLRAVSELRFQLLSLDN